MEDFPVQNNQDNLGSISRFWFIPVDYLLAQGDTLGYVVRSVTKQPGKVWFKGSNLPDTLVFDDSPAETDHGRLYPITLKGSVAGDSVSILKQFSGMLGFKYLVIYCDNNAQYKLIGSKDAGCRFSFKLQKDINQYEFTFSISSSNPCCFVDDTVLI